MEFLSAHCGYEITRVLSNKKLRKLLLLKISIRIMIIIMGVLGGMGDIYRGKRLNIFAY